MSIRSAQPFCSSQISLTGWPGAIDAGLAVSLACGAAAEVATSNGPIETHRCERSHCGVTTCVTSAHTLKLSWVPAASLGTVPLNTTGCRTPGRIIDVG